MFRGVQLLERSVGAAPRLVTQKFNYNLVILPQPYFLSVGQGKACCILTDRGKVTLVYERPVTFEPARNRNLQPRIANESVKNSSCYKLTDMISTSQEQQAFVKWLLDHSDCTTVNSCVSTGCVKTQTSQPFWYSFPLRISTTLFLIKTPVPEPGSLDCSEAFQFLCQTLQLPSSQN